jgi:DnaJ-domain-containing protein 1
MILFLPRVHEGPAGDLFATLQFPRLLLLATALALVLVVIQGVRFNPPWLFLACVAIFSLVVTVTLHVMLANFGWIFFQRAVSCGVGLILLGSGYLYYRAARAWKDYTGAGQQQEVAQISVQDEKLREELGRFVLDLEHFRKQNGYRLVWLQAAAREGGIYRIVEDLLRSGEISAEQRGAATANAGLRAPMKVGGIGSDPLELLAVSSSANMEEIKESYQRIAAFFHHDRVNQLSPEAQQIARKIAGAISRAYRALTKS